MLEEGRGEREGTREESSMERREEGDGEELRGGGDERWNRTHQCQTGWVKQTLRFHVSSYSISLKHTQIAVHTHIGI